MAIHDHLWPPIAKCHQSFVENKIGARKKPLAKSQAAFGVEDNGLEHSLENQRLSHPQDQAARNPARFAGKDTDTLLAFWQQMSGAARKELLRVAKELALSDAANKTEPEHPET